MAVATALPILSLLLVVGCRDSRSPAEEVLATPQVAAETETAPLSPRIVEITDDLAVFYVRGNQNTTQRMVFLHGICAKGLDYIRLFQRAARVRGALIALQGEVDCGNGSRTWARDTEKTDARIDAAFRAIGIPVASRSTTVIGYSQGALLATALASKYPTKYRRLVLIGSPSVADGPQLSALEGAVLMAGTFDNQTIMKEGVKSLEIAGVPAMYMEIPNAKHGELPNGEKVMNDAFTWMDANARESE